ncbi:MAG: C-GCAxxG-C-C family protein, partial [Clostridiales bacterium]|nr:C-GCAxxG-C-C family protein [Clostridiales bacterium]
QRSENLGKAIAQLARFGSSMENKYLERMSELRSHPTIHYSCTQTLLVAFAKECGISEEKAFQLGMHFGGGMKMGSACGAIVGGLMVIGMMGGDDSHYRAFVKAMKENHGGLINCSDLLKKNAEAGGQRKAHCDGMIDEAARNIIRVMNLDNSTALS